MHEEQIKEIVRCHMKIAHALVECLPLGVSEGLNRLGRVIAEGIEQGLQELREQESQRKDSSGKVNQVPIE
jgi:hypothetical protein